MLKLLAFLATAKAFLARVAVAWSIVRTNELARLALCSVVTFALIAIDHFLPVFPYAVIAGLILPLLYLVLTPDSK